MTRMAARKQPDHRDAFERSYEPTIQDLTSPSRPPSAVSATVRRVVRAFAYRTVQAVAYLSLVVTRSVGHLTRHPTHGECAHRRKGIIPQFQRS
jgi:hypothetical protein